MKKCAKKYEIQKSFGYNSPFRVKITKFPEYRFAFAAEVMLFVTS